MNERIVVCGAGGFVGGVLVEKLLRQGFKNIRAVSSRPVDQWIKRFHGPEVQECQLDLRDTAQAGAAVMDAKWVVNLASKVGGVGYIGKNHVDSYLATTININLLNALPSEVGGYFFASSACVYGSWNSPLLEDGILAPSRGYGEEKEYSEKICQAFVTERKVPVRIARFTGIYGPGDSIKGKENKDHVPSALCRKFARAKLSGDHDITIWGDGTQVRDFLYVEDCADAIIKILFSGCDSRPINVAAKGDFSVNELVTMLDEISGITSNRYYCRTAPTGVNRRVLNTDRLFSVVKWLPPTGMMEGLRATYNEIYEQMIMGQ